LDLNIESIFSEGLPESPEDKISCLTKLSSAIVDSTCIESLAVPLSDRDDSTNYVSKLLGMGLLVWDFEDVVKEGDGERLVLLWKFMLLLFKQAGKTKYSLEAFTLLYSLNVSLTAKQSYQLTHNRTCNVKGKQRGNKSLDLQMEHMNRCFKDDISTSSPHLSESTVMKVSRASPSIQSFIETFDRLMAVRPDNGQHTIPSLDTDKIAIFRELVNNKTCQALLGEEYTHYSNVKRDIFDKLHKKDNWAAYMGWLEAKIKEFDYYLDYAIHRK
jgi:L1 cell adhesion molecule like protein